MDVYREMKVFLLSNRSLSSIVLYVINYSNVDSRTSYLIRMIDRLAASRERI